MTPESNPMSQAEKGRLMGEFENFVVETVMEQMPESKKGATPDNFKSQFECPACLTLMKPTMPIVSCSSGHLFCGSCNTGRKSNGCPVCRGWVEGRNLAVEKLRDKCLSA